MTDTPRPRRRFLRAAGLAAVSAALTRLSPAQTEDPPAVADLVTAETQATVDRGLAALARTQADDGSFPDAGGPNVAVTALAGLALMAGGHQPARGRYGRQVSRAVDYVLARSAAAQPAGYLTARTEGNAAHSGMYQHGFGTLFLAEVYGMTADPDRGRRLREGLEKAVALIVKAQNREGGWRYQPFPSEADVSVSVAQMMALRAAKNAGVYVPAATVEACVKYIKGCQLEDGGFCYILGQRFVGSLFPRSAAAVVGLFSAGIYDGREVERGLQYLKRFPPGRGGRDPRGEQYYYYGQYYAALAMWTAGGAYWADWFPLIRDDLLARGRGAAGWQDFTTGSAFATAVACLILQLTNNYLPILQK
jgi:hypothetical protein